MRTIRLYLDQTLQTNSDVCVTDDRFHYLAHVLRVKVGTNLTLFNGQGGEYRGELVALEKKRALIRIADHSVINRESPLHITLAIGVSRGERMTYVMQKSVELGVTAIQPLFTRYCEVKLDEERAEKRQQHWQGIVVAAAEQCGRTRLPLVHTPLTLAEWLAGPGAAFDHRLVLRPQADITLRQLRINTPAALTALVGPEGGLSDDEVALARRYDFTAVSLGPRILRTETAAAATLGALQAIHGDL